MTEDKFVDILTNGKQEPRLKEEYVRYYKSNPWQIPEGPKGKWIKGQVESATCL
jgi:hypothetical protein